MAPEPTEAAPDRAIRSGVTHQLYGGRILPRSVSFLFGLTLGVVVVLLAEYLVAITAGSDLEESTEHLVIMMDRDQSLGQRRHELIAEWNERHPNIKVRIVEVSPSATAARSQMVAHGQSGATPAADIYSLDVTWTAEFASAGLIRPLDESRLDLDGFLPGPLSTGRYDGKQYALPFNTDAGLLFYRKDLIAAAPISLDEMVAQIGNFEWRDQEQAETGEEAEAEEEEEGEEAEEEDSEGEGEVEPVEAGFVGQLADYEGFTVNALELIWAAGGEVVDDDGQAKPVDGMRVAVRRLSQYFTGPNPVILPDSLAYDEDRSRQAFQQGRVLFMRNWPVTYRLLTEPASGEDGTAPMDPAKIGVAQLPWRSVLGGQNLAIAASTERPRAAQALIEFLTSDRSQQKLYEGGFAPTREVVYYDRGPGTNTDLMLALLEAVRDARPRPSTRHYEQFSDVFRSIVREAAQGNGALPPNTTEVIAAALKGEVAGPGP